MIHQQRPIPLWGERTPVRACWMCGIRLPADQMVADGGDACHDLRWYCRDTVGCTERWTSRSIRSAAIRQAEAPKTLAKQATDTDVAKQATGTDVAKQATGTDVAKQATDTDVAQSVPA